MSNFSINNPCNLAPSGIATFAKSPICSNLDDLNADLAIIGIPSDIGIQGKTGTRLGPRGIRVASTRFTYKTGGSYDPERNTSYLDTDIWTIVDCGDVDYIPGDLEGTFENIEAAITKIIDKDVIPVIMGGDHSITYPIIKGFKNTDPFNIIKIDSHLDWTKDIGGQKLSNGSPMRNASKLPYVKNFLHLGVSGIGSSNPSDFKDAKENGDQIHSPKQVREIGIKNIINNFEQNSRCYVTFDIDAMDYSIAAGTGSPMFGGFYYDEMVDILETIANYCNVIGFDMVEVSPPYDDDGSTTCYLAARLMSDFMGFITKKKEQLV